VAMILFEKTNPICLAPRPVLGVEKVGKWGKITQFFFMYNFYLTDFFIDL
jgi:hypothetical protein